MARLLSRKGARHAADFRKGRPGRSFSRSFRAALAVMGLTGLLTTGWAAATTGWGAASRPATTGWGAATAAAQVPAQPGTTGWGAVTGASAAAPVASRIQLTAATRPASVSGAARPDQPAAGICQVPGIGDIGGLLGFCAAGSSGLIGDANNICQPSVPTPEPATGGIDSLIRPPANASRQPATLYDSYGVGGQSWAAYDMQCSDMTSMIGNNVAGVVFDAAKALDRVTITVYQSAAGEGILTWLTGAVDRLITSLGNAIYFPYLAPVVILGAIWLAWQGLIRKRASRTIEGTIWMVVACAAATWLIARPADFTGFGKTVSDGITQTLDIAFAKLPAPQQASCVPVGRADPQAPALANYSYTAGNGVVDQNANELWTVLVCKPWLDGEFGTTAYTTGHGKPTVVNRYGRQLLWSQAIAANERATPALIQAKQDTYAGIANAIKQNDPAVYPLFQGKQWTTRLEIAFAALFAALIAGVLVLLIAITLIILKLGFLLLLVAGPFFLIVGTHPGFGRVVATRWGEMLVGVLLKQAAVALVLSVLLYAYSLIMGTSDAALPWALKILMIALVTVAVFIYRKPFAHLFSAVGYGMIGSRERAETGLARAATAAGRNTVDAATVAVPGFAAYRVARWARRNPAQAASLAAQVTTGAGVGAAAAGAAAAGNGQPADAHAADGEAPEAGSPDGRQPASARPGVAARPRTRGDGAGGAPARKPPPLDLPPRQPAAKPAPVPGWTRGGANSGRAVAAGRPAPPPVPARESPPAAARPTWPHSPGPATRSGGNGAGARVRATARDGAAGPSRAPARTAGGQSAAASRPAAFGQTARSTGGGAAGGAAGPFWLRPFRRRK